MTKNVSKVLVLAGGFALSAACLAGRPTSTTAPSVVPMHYTHQFSPGAFYVGAQVGGADVDSSFITNVTDSSAIGFLSKHHDGWDLAGRISGGYLWNYNGIKVGAELGGTWIDNSSYTYLSKAAAGEDPAEYTKLKVENYLIDLLAVVDKSISDKFCVFAKAGVAYVNTSIKQSTDGGTSSDFVPSYHKYDPEVQVGLGYSVSDNLSLTGTYGHVFGNKLKLTWNGSATPPQVETNGKSPTMDEAFVGLVYSVA